MSSSNPSNSRQRGRGFGSFLFELRNHAWNTIKQWSLKRWIAVCVAAVIIVLILRFASLPELEILRNWAAQHGSWFVLAFWIGYVVLTLFPLPRTLWTVSAGILFGPSLGMLIATTALTVSAIVAFLIVRSILGEWIRPHLTHPAVLSTAKRLEARGWVAVFSLRMISGVPFSLLNYLAALTPIKLSQFSLATFVGSIPTTAIGVFFGDALITGANPLLLSLMIFLALLGLLGLYIDARLLPPVKSGR